MEKNKTAVEWLVDFFESGVSSVEEWTKAKEQAKAMEKQQMDYARRMSMLCSCDENEPTTKVNCCDTCGKIAEGYWVTKLHDYNPRC